MQQEVKLEGESSENTTEGVYIKKKWGEEQEVNLKRYMTNHEEELCITAENANCICASTIPAGRRKSFGNEDKQPAYGWI